MFWITFTAIYLVFALYFFLRLVYPLGWRWPFKAIAFVLLVAPVGQRFISDESLFAVPDSIMLVPSWLFLCSIVGAILALLADIVCLILRLVRVPVAWKRCIPVILSVTLGVTLYGMYEGLKVPPVTHFTLSFQNLPQSLQGKTIGVVADPQITRFFRGTWLQEGLEKLMAEKPDMIVIVGDAVDAAFHLLQEEAKAFALLQAPLGVYFVSGNHEYYAGYKEWGKYFRSLPQVTVLDNAHFELEIEESILQIVGLTDPVAPRYGLRGPSAQRAMQGLAPKQDNTFRLLLAHRPYHEEYVKVEGDLHIAGHTHGGVILPIREYVAYRNGGFVSGVYKTASGTLFVSKGMGLWDGFLMRLGISSEIPLITLEKATP